MCFEFTSEDSFAIFRYICRALDQIRAAPAFYQRAFPARRVVNLVQVIRLDGGSRLVASIDFFPGRLYVFAYVVFVMRFMRSRVRCVFDFYDHDIPISVVGDYSYLRDRDYAFDSTSMVEDSPFY